MCRLDAPDVPKLPVISAVRPATVSVNSGKPKSLSTHGSMSGNSLPPGSTFSIRRPSRRRACFQSRDARRKIASMLSRIHESWFLFGLAQASIRDTALRSRMVSRFELVIGSVGLGQIVGVERCAQ